MGRTANVPFEPDSLNPLFLCKVALDSGGYDNGGAYWGLRLGREWLYCYGSAQTGMLCFIDAVSRQAAKDAILEMYPEAKFKR